jgi:hypothetical protein
VTDALTVLSWSIERMQNMQAIFTNHNYSSLPHKVTVNNVKIMEWYIRNFFYVTCGISDKQEISIISNSTQGIA